MTPGCELVAIRSGSWLRLLATQMLACSSIAGRIPSIADNLVRDNEAFEIVSMSRQRLGLDDAWS
ncbi:hypothetical protein GFL21_20975 [Rhizobium anhuiense]|uniref:hypothetical protein n=1 Tax=Rhizobium anhuiense TaxID=1184720 RepID=UPI0006463BFB|nr:hypothetical protein [Rhizobium anhuiense]NKM56965.1 hypothetical protein [Rhizobium anhuiense]